MTQTPEQIAAGLNGEQRLIFDVLFRTNGQLTVVAFEDLPPELIDARYEGGIFRQAYPSALAHAARALISKETNND